MAALTLGGCQCFVPVGDGLQADAGDAGRPDAGKDAGPGVLTLPECIAAADCRPFATQTSRWCSSFGDDGGVGYSCFGGKCAVQCKGGLACSAKTNCLECTPVGGGCKTSSCFISNSGALEEVICHRGFDAGYAPQASVTFVQDASNGCSGDLLIAGRKVGTLYGIDSNQYWAEIPELGGTCLGTQLPTGALRIALDCPKCNLTVMGL